jgi:CelD/BcsL family acetyltransferase involved in cellulose biosynthesis
MTWRFRAGLSTFAPFGRILQAAELLDFTGAERLDFSSARDKRSSSQLDFASRRLTSFSARCGRPGMLSLRSNIACSTFEMDRIEPLWNEILRQQDHTMFQSFAWNRLAAELFRDRFTPWVAWMESDSGAAIIPAAINHVTQRVELLGEALFDYRDVLSIGDPELLRLAWHQIAACGKSLHVTSLLKSAANARWPDFPRIAFVKAPQVDRAAVDEHEFRLAHSRLGRQMRRLQKLGITLRVHAGSDSAAVRRLYECKRKHFAADSDNLFLDQHRCEFMVIAAAIEQSRCELFTLEDDAGKLIAGLVSFRDGTVRRCYTIYFHPEWARYSPGVALLYEVTAQSLGEGLSCDYMTGEYPYKLRLANASLRLYRVDASAPELAEIAEHRISSVA